MKTVLKTDVDGWSKITKIILKYAVYYLGFGMLQLYNCCLNDRKTWSNSNIGWEGIPLDNGQWKEGEFRVVLVSINLAECHRVEIPGVPMFGLYVVRKVHGHKAIYNCVDEAETGYRLSAS